MFELLVAVKNLHFSLAFLVHFILAFTSPLWGKGELSQLSLNNNLHHMIINNISMVLRSVDQAMSADLVHHSGRSAGKLENLVHRTI